MNTPPSRIEAIVHGPALKPVDRVLQHWRISKAKPYIRNGARILDVGCADGELFRQLGRRIGSGVGVDHALMRTVGNERFQLIARTLSPNWGNAEEFDVITMLAVVEHLTEGVIPNLRDMCVRLLKPAGVLIITVPSARVDRILAWLGRLHLIVGMSLHEHHGFEPATVPDWFGGTGLALVEASQFQFGLNNLFVFKKVAMAPCAADTQLTDGTANTNEMHS
jgi:2-polyprenyl-3-methyl-5-hydroxy-6-metoxy-1,4-benzoquinol methylase